MSTIGCWKAFLFMLGNGFVETGKKPMVIIGFGSADEVFLEAEFRKLGAETTVTTADGSMGIPGFVTDALAALSREPDCVFSCGPELMMKALAEKTTCPGQFSFEERMGCGFGACMGCSCKTKYGNKRICRDGPVLDREEIIW